MHPVKKKCNDDMKYLLQNAIHNLGYGVAIFSTFLKSDVAF
jgi:zinc transporter ZupT